ncbi:MAG: transketolase [Bacteroidetes bacterium]|nr:transketolase [Bacteroidota bacterium]
MTYEELLLQIAGADERVVVLTAENRAAIRNLPSQLDGRFMDVGIAEMTMIGAAAGLALRGRIPVVHALATFLTLRAFEFIRTDVGIAGLPVKLIGAVPGFLSDGNGPTHQAIEDISLMRGIPGMQVFAPADVDELLAGLPDIIASPRPWYVRFNGLPSVTAHHEPFAIGRAEVHGDGNEVAILTYGFMFRETHTALQLLQAEGLQCRLVNLRTVKPLDETAVLRAVRECGLIVTVEDHFRTGGLYSILAELLLERQLTARVLPIALEDRWFRPATLPRVLEFEECTGRDIAARILVECERGRHAAMAGHTETAAHAEAMFKTYL